jgi:hypothetical protein
MHQNSAAPKPCAALAHLLFHASQPASSTLNRCRSSRLCRALVGCDQQLKDARRGSNAPYAAAVSAPRRCSSPESRSRSCSCRAGAVLNFAGRSYIVPRDSHIYTGKTVTCMAFGLCTAKASQDGAERGRGGGLWRSFSIRIRWWHRGQDHNNPPSSRDGWWQPPFLVRSFFGLNNRYGDIIV